jgi:dipeptidase
MKKLVIIFLTLTMYGCVSLSIGNRSIANEENKNANDTNTVYSQNGKTMVAINYILPQRAGQFEMLTKTVIMPAMKREDAEVFKSLKFLVPEEQNEDGNLTYMFIADPYLEERNYDIFEVLVSQYGRTRAEEYFDRWISCFAYEQEVISFR